MKRYYQIIELKTGKHVPGLFFENREAAREERKKLNQTDEATGKETLRYVITRGPDHPDGEVFGSRSA